MKECAEQNATLLAFHDAAETKAFMDYAKPGKNLGKNAIYKFAFWALFV